MQGPHPRGNPRYWKRRHRHSKDIKAIIDYYKRQRECKKIERENAILREHIKKLELDLVFAECGIKDTE